MYVVFYGDIALTCIWIYTYAMARLNMVGTVPRDGIGVGLLPLPAFTERTTSFHSYIYSCYFAQAFLATSHNNVYSHCS